MVVASPKTIVGMSAKEYALAMSGLVPSGVGPLTFFTISDIQGLQSNPFRTTRDVLSVRIPESGCAARALAGFARVK